MQEHKFLPLSKIVIPPERQRKYFDEIKMAELVADIELNDLIHAISVSEHNVLISGERRLRAIAILYRAGKTFHYGEHKVPWGTVPVVVVRQKDEEGYFGMELAENITRTDLTWQEKAEAIARYHTFRESQTIKEQTYTDTARELFPNTSANPTVVSESMILTKYLDDPEVAKAKSQKEALKIVERKAKDARILALSSKITSRPEDRHRIIHGRMEEELPKLPDGCVDVILTDPPYGIGADNFNDRQPIPHQYDDSYDTWQRLMLEFAFESFRVTKPEAFLYAFCDIRRWEELSALMTTVGWDVWTRPLIWFKGHNGILPRPQHGPRYVYEAILYAIKGNRQVMFNGLDVLSYPSAVAKYHAAEKPVELYVELLRRASEPGNLVLDPFAGSGPIIPAANVLSLEAIAIEPDARFYNYTLTRLQEGRLL